MPKYSCFQVDIQINVNAVKNFNKIFVDFNIPIESLCAKGKDLEKSTQSKLKKRHFLTL